MRKRLCGIAFVMVMLLTLCCAVSALGEGQSYHDIEALHLSGSAEDEIKYRQIRTMVQTQTTGGFLPMQSDYGYQALKSEKKQFLYQHLKESIYSISDEADENGHYRISRIKVRGQRLSEFDLREVINAFINDNPEYFWIENLFGYAYAGILHRELHGHLVSGLLYQRYLEAHRSLLGVLDRICQEVCEHLLNAEGI